jgi:hypothetical protein
MKTDDPERWLANPGGAPPGAVELLRAARRPSPPPAPLRAQLGQELQRLASMPRLPLLRWPVLSGLGVAAVGVTGWLALSHPRPAVSPAAVAAATAPREAPPPPVAPPAPQPMREAPPPAPAAVTVPTPVRAPSVRRAPVRSASDSLAREAALIDAARRAVRGQPSEALASLDRHRREFPAGQLAAEREFLTVAALVQLGRRPEAEARGRRLSSDYPGSAYARQVPALLARGAGD